MWYDEGKWERGRVMGRRFLIALVLLALLITPVLAAEETITDPPVKIHTVEELLAMGESGSYILMNDLDMSGVSWHCPTFTGTFDGNGHALLNLTLTQPAQAKDSSYDGNQNRYDTAFVGLFGSLYDAVVKDLRLVNVRCVMETGEHCFVGGIAGNSRRSTIENCTVTGWLELRADTKMFGVGGVVGYGSGTVRGCTVDMTLICTDLNKKQMDEQFLGGVFSTGFMNVENCDVTIDGYSSDYGYVHNGGITGMYLQYPIGEGKEGRITGNRIRGKITFFECNPDRRAYCRAEAGEILAFWYTVEGNEIDFLRDERWEYDRELRPHNCADAQFTERLQLSGCDSYGYSVLRCQNCGWEYKDHYTLPSHSVTVWTVTRQPTFTEEGLSEGLCDRCGLAFTRSEPVLEPLPTQSQPPATQAPTEPSQTPTLPQPTEDPAQEETEDPVSPLLVFAVMGIVSIGLVIFLICRPRKGGKYAR